jgi:hypothetical protein
VVRAEDQGAEQLPEGGPAQPDLLGEQDSCLRHPDQCHQAHPRSEGNAGRYANYGIFSAIISLFFAPEIFGSAAIILGAYAWKMDTSSSKKGLYIVIVRRI